MGGGLGGVTLTPRSGLPASHALTDAGIDRYRAAAVHRAHQDGRLRLTGRALEHAAVVLALEISQAPRRHLADQVLRVGEHIRMQGRVLPMLIALW